MDELSGHHSPLEQPEAMEGIGSGIRSTLRVRCGLENRAGVHHLNCTLVIGANLAQDALSFLQPQLLRWLLLYISDYQRARSDGTELPSTIQGFSIVTIMVSL
jgi:hypothetical protein